MIKLFGRIHNYMMRVVLAYYDLKSKNYQRHKCSYCGKRNMFEVPKGVSVEQILFICEPCGKKHVSEFVHNGIDELYESNLKDQFKSK